VAFCNHWYPPAARLNFRTEFPYELSLGPDSTVSPTGTTILVTEAYDKMYRRLLHLREVDRVGPTVRGAVVTGQSGVGAPLTRSPPHMTTYCRICFPGKTVFQKFMLAQLISAQEVVLLCDSVEILLFFRGRVYYRPTNSGFVFLPRPPVGLYYPIWTLVDVNTLYEPPIQESWKIWPVQTSSPNPIRWRYWSKHNKAALLGIPLWNMQELISGYVFPCSPSSSQIPAMPFGGAYYVTDRPSPLQPLSSARVPRLSKATGYSTPHPNFRPYLE